MLSWRRIWQIHWKVCSHWTIPIQALTKPPRFIQLVRKLHPHSLLHFEDFRVTNTHGLLDRYQEAHAMFNDDNMYASLFPLFQSDQCICLLDRYHKSHAVFNDDDMYTSLFPLFRSDQCTWSPRQILWVSCCVQWRWYVSLSLPSFLEWPTHMVSYTDTASLMRRSMTTISTVNFPLCSTTMILSTLLWVISHLTFVVLLLVAYTDKSIISVRDSLYLGCRSLQSLNKINFIASTVQ